MKLPAGPLRVTVDETPWPLHGSDATRRAEQAAGALRPPYGLMAEAGLSVARLAMAMAPQAGAAHIWAGPGNNGGDGYVAARHLHAAGWRVSVTALGAPDHMPTDARHAWEAAQAAGLSISAEMPSELDPETLYIDALLGLGAARAPEGAVAGAIARINAHRGQVLAVDLPSGLHPDTGCCAGAAVRATATLSLLSLKPGLYTASGRDHSGQVWLDRLGVEAGPADAWLTGDCAASGRPEASHKGRYGDVAVVGGAPGMVGAAWLCARAALAAGAGRVYVSPLDESASLLDPTHAELMGRRAWWAQAPATLATTTVACGCGGGPDVRKALPALLRHVARLVLDADALNAIAEDSSLQTPLRTRTARGLSTLLTPHPLEAARLLGCDTAEVQSDRLAAAQRLAARYACAVVLKGSGSIVAAPGHLPAINSTGNEALATAGTGDVLAGWASGLWAQLPDADAWLIGTMAAGQHGAAADAWRSQQHTGPLRASDLVEALARRGAPAAADRPV